ncbi:MAG: T9SS type A sorting domain-containing protein [Saprospiraceae bacterium]|nr:T9SS type A sorting domain-containing protein [Saprospiraceae bacterium]
MKLRYLLLLLMFIGVVVNNNAQTTLMVSENSAQQNDIINVSIKVSGYVNIVSSQFSIKWDTTKLRYLNATNYNLPDLNDANFGNVKASTGILSFSWFHNNLIGVTREDNSHIFQLRFKAIGNNTFAPITIENIPTVIEIADANSAPQTVQVQNGGVSIGQPSGTTDVNFLGNLGLYQNSPNPFKDYTLIQLEMAIGSEVTLSIVDIEGRVLYNKTNNYPAGKHTVKIDKNIFNEAGVYFYKIQAGQDMITKRMVFIK